MSDDNKEKKGKGFLLMGKKSAPDNPVATDTRDLNITPRQPMTGAMGGTKQQRICIDMPVSKRKAECGHMLLDPDMCVPSKLNIRHQAFLTKTNADFMSLVDAIELDGQQTPVLARPILVDGVQKYEIVYGTRRRAAVAYLVHAGSKDLKLRAWVSSDITDADAKQLALGENLDRSDLSPWEKAKFIQSEEAKKVPIATIADSLKVSAKTIYQYLSVASIPEEVVAFFASPNLVSAGSGAKIATMIKSMDNNQIEKLREIFADEPAESSSAVLKAIKGIVTPPAPPVKLSKKSATKWKSPDTSASYAIKPHKTIPDAYTMSIRGVKPDAMPSILEDLNKAIHHWLQNK